MTGHYCTPALFCLESAGYQLTRATDPDQAKSAGVWSKIE